MLDGISVTIDGNELIIPALNFASIRRLRPQIDALAMMPLSAGLSDEQIDTVITIIHTALVRNYPAITKADVEEMLTIANVRPIVNAIMGISGFVPGGAEADGRIGT